MATAYSNGWSYRNKGQGHEVLLPEPNGDALRWLHGNGDGVFDYHFPSAEVNAVIFTFSDKGTATLFKLFFEP